MHQGSRHSAPWETVLLAMRVGYKNLDLVELVLLDHGVTATGDARGASRFRIRSPGILILLFRNEIILLSDILGQATD